VLAREKCELGLKRTERTLKFPRQITKTICRALVHRRCQRVKARAKRSVYGALDTRRSTGGISPHRRNARSTSMRASVVMAMLMVVSMANAQGKRGPPKEALNACVGKSDGASCSVVLREHTVSGTCHAGPNGEALACLPAPPPEAVSACAGLSEGTACGFTFEGQNLVGTCHALACLPSPMGEGGRRPGEGPGELHP